MGVTKQSWRVIADPADVPSILQKHDHIPQPPAYETLIPRHELHQNKNITTILEGTVVSMGGMHMNEVRLPPEVRSKLLGNFRYDRVYRRISPTFERCCASQLFGGARLCCWAPDAVKSRIVFVPIEWRNPSSKCASFSNLALCSTRSLWRENSRQWGGLASEPEAHLEPLSFFLEDLNSGFRFIVYTL